MLDIVRRYTTEPMVAALENFQEQNGLKIDGYAKPGGPTEQAINNRLTGKPRGAGLLHDFEMSIGDSIGNGFKNEPRDVATVKRALGGLGYLPEDPFDRPSGFIEESTTKAVKRFQDDNRLTSDGWLAPGGESEAALQEAVARLARVKRPAWLEYQRRAPSPDALKGIGILDSPAEVARWVAQLFKTVPGASRGDLLEIRGPGTRIAGTDPTDGVALTPTSGPPNASPNEGIGSSSFDPEANFGSWAVKPSDVLPEGVTPPANPLKPDVLGGVPSDGMRETDVGIDRKREVRFLISRLYRVGAQDEAGNHRLSDTDFDAYLARAKEHLEPEHYAIFELTARAVRAGALDWHTAATRLAAYYAPETTGEAVVDFLLDLTPIVGNLKAAKELHSALENAVDAAAYGDARAHDDALTAAALAMAGLIMPATVGKAALKATARLLKQELHHLVPFYLGGIKDGPLMALSRAEHRGAMESLHTKMQDFFRSSRRYRGLAHDATNTGEDIVAGYTRQFRRSGLNAFYRTLRNSPIAHEREAFEAWLKIFPETRKYFRR